MLKTNRLLIVTSILLLVGAGSFVWYNYQATEDPKPRSLKIAILNAQLEKNSFNRMPPLPAGEFQKIFPWVFQSGASIAYAPISQNNASIPLRKLELEPVSGRKINPQDYPVQQLLELVSQDYGEEKDWIMTASETANDFLDFSKSFLNGEEYVKRLDVAGSLNRSFSYLCELEIGEASGKYLIIYDLAEDNSLRELKEVSCDMEILVVSSSPSLGILDSLSTESHPFESFSAALRYVVEKESYVYNGQLKQKDP